MSEETIRILEAGSEFAKAARKQGVTRTATELYSRYCEGGSAVNPCLQPARVEFTDSLAGNGVINIRIPFAVKRRGCRKLILSPNGDNAIFDAKPQQDHSLIKVLVRAYKWRKHFETGQYRSLDDLAEKLQINKSYLARVVRINLLAPDIKEAILNGTQPRTLTTTVLLKPFPELWEEQATCFGFTKAAV